MRPAKRRVSGGALKSCRSWW